MNSHLPYTSRIPDMWVNGKRARALAVAVVSLGALVAAGAALHWKTSRNRELEVALDSLRSRPFEGRFAEAGTMSYQPFSTAVADDDALDRVRQETYRLEAEWRSTSSHDAARRAAVGYAFDRNAARAQKLLTSLLTHESDWTRVVAAIATSRDSVVLTDYSAAMLQDARETVDIVLAYEAADRAWRLAPTQSAAWNRALAAERIGLFRSAARAWARVAEEESSPQWKSEAQARQIAAIKRAAAPGEPSLEVFFYKELEQQAAAGKPLIEVSSDHLAADTAAYLLETRDVDRHQLQQAITNYLQGRDAFERNEFEEARQKYALAERSLSLLRSPLVLIARDQRIRSECSQARPGCLASMQAFHREIVTLGRYPWLEARCVYAVGQILYRQGRIYEALDHLQTARALFERLHDSGSAAHMNVLLANVYGAAGESDVAVRHFFAALATPAPPILDRRRKHLEDAINFLLRHGCLATVELLLDELAASSTTPSSDVIEATLRGVVAFRRGDRARAAQQFAHAHRLVDTLRDAAARGDVAFRLAIAEAGCRLTDANPIVERLDEAIAALQQGEYSVWLPTLLAERGAARERRNDLAGAERDYELAIDILESREPRIDQTVFSLGITGDADTAFDRLIRLRLAQQRPAEALAVAERSMALRISVLHARGAGVRDAFRVPRERLDPVLALRRVLRNGEVGVVQHFLRDEVVTWMIDNGSIRVTRRHARRDDVASAVTQLRTNAAAVEAASRYLLRDWIDHVPKGATIFIAPAAELPGVAFAVLTATNGEPLLLRNALVTAPSVTAFARALREDRQRESPQHVFFAAAPLPGGNLTRLPLTVPEVTESARLYRDARVDTHATRASFIDASSSSSTVHFAGHITVNETQPLFSALAFENGERLYVHELDARSFGRARLVVLSACDSGRSPRPTMSVANALLSLGVPSVVYTLWPVTDQAAEAFAVAFHSAIRDGVSRVDAVRRAQQAVMRKWPNDRAAWGAFALAGAAREITEGERGKV